MALKNRKIRKRHRGKRTCGRGKKGSRRKSHGVGLSGSKRHIKSYVTKYMPGHIGRQGMGGKKEDVKFLNLDYIDRYARENNLNEIDIDKLGYQRVLGRGNLTKPLTIKARTFTKKAIEKIEAAGGKAVTL